MKPIYIQRKTLVASRNICLQPNKTPLFTPCKKWCFAWASTCVRGEQKHWGPTGREKWNLCAFWHHKGLLSAMECFSAHCVKSGTSQKGPGVNWPAHVLFEDNFTQYLAFNPIPNLNPNAIIPAHYGFNAYQACHCLKLPQTYPGSHFRLKDLVKTCLLKP